MFVKKLETHEVSRVCYEVSPGKSQREARPERTGVSMLIIVMGQKGYFNPYR